MDIYLLSYNNYYNRIYKREETLSAYLSFVVYQVAGVNTWANGDGVDNIWTTGIVSEDIAGVDYMLTCTGDKILGRWFVIEKNEISKNRYKLTLRRDLLAESLPTIENDAFFAERCILPDTSPYIYNAEDFRVNRIKTKETLIKDKTGVPWIIGYFNKGIESKEISFDLNNIADITVDSLENWEYNKYRTSPFPGYPEDDALSMELYWANAFEENPFTYYIYDKATYKLTKEKNTATYNIYSTPKELPAANLIDGYLHIKQSCPSLSEVSSALPFSVWGNAIRKIFKFSSKIETSKFLSLDGAIIKDASSGEYYRISIRASNKMYSQTIFRDMWNSPGVFDIDQICKTKLNGRLDFGININRVLFKVFAAATWSYLDLENITATVDTFSYSIPKGHRDTEDAPYDVLAIPYGEFKKVGNEKTAMSAINALVKAYNAGANSPLFDVQLLPFCPLFETDTTNLTENVDYVKIKGPAPGNKILGYVYFSSRSSFSLSLPLKNPVSVKNPKIENVCDLYRLVSPNYNGQFEFTAAKNGGINVINVDATYIPFNPFIRIAPAFGGLYGSEFKDARGLICGGDFSLPIITSAWVSYQQNNKQYQNIFDRQIKNIEFTQEQQRIQERWNAATGVVSGAVQGGQMGAPAGLWGAAAGAVVGAGASLVGAGLDQYYNELARREAIGYSKDVHRLSLQNIEAQPDSLTRTTAFNAINKIFPILEYFTCTDEEKHAIAKSISENSMRAGFVTTIAEIAQNHWYYGDLEDRGYISGKLIRASLNEDPHYLISLNSELLTGFYRR